LFQRCPNSTQTFKTFSHSKLQSSFTCIHLHSSLPSHTQLLRKMRNPRSLLTLPPDFFDAPLNSRFAARSGIDGSPMVNIVLANASRQRDFFVKVPRDTVTVTIWHWHWYQKMAALYISANIRRILVLPWPSRGKSLLGVSSRNSLTNEVSRREGRSNVYLAQWRINHFSDKSIGNVIREVGMDTWMSSISHEIMRKSPLPNPMREAMDGIGSILITGFGSITPIKRTYLKGRKEVVSPEYRVIRPIWNPDDCRLTRTDAAQWSSSEL
jgi:hypothetical protein